MQASEKLFLQTVGRFVAERLQALLAPLIERLDKVEARLPPDLDARIEARMSARWGSVAAWMADERAMLVETVLAKIPSGKDGKDGRNGADGKSVAADDLKPLLDGLVVPAVAAAVAGLPARVSVVGGFIDRAGDLHHTLSNGDTVALGHVVGKDGKDGRDGRDAQPHEIIEAIKAEVAKFPVPKDGRDGLGFKDMSATYDGERTFVFKFVLDDRVEVLSFKAPFMLYRGVWRAGAYEQGDVVTHGGSMFVAKQATDKQPETIDSGWQLAAKRGRDGKPGDAGKPGPTGKDGRSGRDLTQIGPDGSKW